MKAIVATALLMSAGCGYVDGVCWRRDEGGHGSGVGGGPIVPGGVGGYGAVEPEPQALGPDGDMPVECWTEACHDKCDRQREEDQHACQKIPADKQDACRQRARASAAECHERCDKTKKEREECDSKYQDCVNNGPASCSTQKSGSTQCYKCWERCNAGDSPTAACRKCRF